jgi:carbon monoxide dehydrogenase subunit G
MARTEHTVVVERPPDEVFAFLTDLSSVPEWQSGAVEVRQPESEVGGGVGVGTKYVEVLKFLGRQFEATIEVTEYEPGRRFSIKTLSRPIPFQVQHTLEPSNGGGTKLHVTLEGEPGGLFKIAEPLVMRNAQRQVASDFATLKRLVETRTPAGSSRTDIT